LLAVADIRRVNNLLGLYVSVLVTPLELLGENDEPRTPNEP
jgi:hypothetical protein